MKFLGRSIVFVALVAGVAAAPAAAQAPEERITVNFTPAFATVGGDTELALSGSAGYRFTEHLSFEGDFTWIDAAEGGGLGRVFPLGSSQFTSSAYRAWTTGSVVTFGAPSLDLRNIRTFPNLPTIPIPVEGFDLSNDGQTIIATLGVRYEPTVQTARFRPYVSGGLGINHTEQELIFRIASMTAFDESISHTGFAFSAGGGAGIRLFSSVWANADAKIFRLSRDRNVIRFGGGVGFRF